ncbi:hypothetical protein BS78_09G106800, partial [Paspalum vaginatum]
YIFVYSTFSCFPYLYIQVFYISLLMYMCILFFVYSTFFMFSIFIYSCILYFYIFYISLFMHSMYFVYFSCHLSFMKFPFCLVLYYI